MSDLLWFLGWRPGFSLFLTLAFAGGGFYLAGDPAGAAAGVLPLALWMAGVVYVNRNYEEFLDAGLDVAREEGEEKLSLGPGEADAYGLHLGYGEVFLVDPYAVYEITYLYVGDSFLGIYEGPAFDLKKRANSPGRQTRELYYENIDSVRYDDMEFTVRTTSGEALTYPSSHAPANSALNSVRQRLREVKASA